MCRKRFLGNVDRFGKGFDVFYFLLKAKKLFLPLGDAIASGAVFFIFSSYKGRTGGWTGGNGFGARQITQKTVGERERENMCQWELIGTIGRATE